MTGRSSHFEQRKRAILNDLSKPSDTYSDLSPKGTVDDEIRELVENINSYEGLVTTSSCAGRISVFLEGVKASATSHEQVDSNGEAIDLPGGPQTRLASKGGKGGGGRWLYVSHKPLDVSKATDESIYLKLFGLCGHDASIPDPVALSNSQRLVHFKFEPLIIHLLAASREEANRLLAAAHEAGFRESGAATVPSSRETPIPIAIRTVGLAFDNIVGIGSATCNEDIQVRPIVSESYLKMLVDISNEKFSINSERKQRFGQLLAVRMGTQSPSNSNWEDPKVRLERKKREGLEAQTLLRRSNAKDTQPCYSWEAEEGPSLGAMLG